MTKKTEATETEQGCLSYFALIIAIIFGAITFSDALSFFGSQDSEQATVAIYSVDAELLNCRESPDRQSPILTQLEAGLEVAAIGSKDGWIEVAPEQIPNGSCWVSSNYMTLVEVSEDTLPSIGSLFGGLLASILPAFYFLWDRRRVSKIRRLMEAEAEAQAEEAKAAKAENRKKQQAKERENKSKIEKLLQETNEALEREKKECARQYSKLVSTIEREETVLRDLEIRHPELVRLMKTRGIDDSSGKPVKDLHAAFKKLD